MPPLVSIIVPVWNEEKHVIHCLLSIVKQTYENFEVIVVDDGSTDNSRELITDFVDNHPHFFLRSFPKNSGTGAALDAGFGRARGKYCTWIAADNWVTPNYLEVLVSALESNPDIDFVYSDWFQVEDINNPEKLPQPTPEYDKKALQRAYAIGPSWLFRKTLKDKMGPFCSGISEDYYMALIMSHYGKFKRIPGHLYYWRNHPENLTARVNMPTHWRASHIAKAQARWKTAKYKVAYICPSLDAAGVGWLLTTGMNSISDDFAMRHIMNDDTVVNAGKDIQANIHRDETRQILGEADIIYINNHFPCNLLPKNQDLPWIDLHDYVKIKPNIIHMHGGCPQWNRDKMEVCKKEFNTLGLTCTPGLDNLRWVPNFIPFCTEFPSLINEYYYLPEPGWPNRSGPVRFLCHHNYLPGKGVLQINEMFNCLEQNWHEGIIPKLERSVGAEKKFNLYEHLMFKKHYDVCIDQITHGYVGMAAWEAMCQGLVVIARMDELTLREYKKLGEGTLPPILNARLLDDVARQVMALSADRELVKSLGIEGHEWMKRYYNAPKIIGIYENIFREVLGITKTSCV